MKTSRRDFLKKSSAAISAFTVLPSYVALGAQSSSGAKAPSERVNVAFVGFTGRGGADFKSMVNTGLCNVVALCDVDLERSDAKKTAAAYPGVPTFTDFRVMFDKMANKIDAVVVATADHSHFAVCMLAMSLGKHVYCEKPLARTFGECKRMIDLAGRSGVVTQMGNQGHSGPNYFQFKAWTEAGVIKDVTKITAYMTRWRRWHGWGITCTGYPEEPMPKGMNWEAWTAAAHMNPFSSKLHPGNWRSWFDYGSGCFGDWGPHILDTCHQFLKLGHPEKITAVRRDNPNPYVYPQASIIRFDFPAREGMPPCVVTWYDGQGNEPPVEKQYRDFISEDGNQKTAGKVIYSKTLVFRGGTHSDTLRIVPRDKYMEMRDSLPKYPTKNSDHAMNYLLACKGEEKSRSPFSIGGSLTQVFNLGILAQRFGGELEFDRQTQQITNNETANAFLDPVPRKGWEEFYTL